MAEISASQVVELRKITGQGMMDCKKALEESGGDMNKAVEDIAQERTCYTSQTCRTRNHRRISRSR